MELDGHISYTARTRLFDGVHTPSDTAVLLLLQRLHSAVLSVAHTPIHDFSVEL
jgi:hypothetical protein